MSTPRRIYLVTTQSGHESSQIGNARLIRAANAAQARSYAARNTFSVAVASQEQLVELLSADTPTLVEDASEQEVA